YLADFGALNEKSEDTESQLRTLNFQSVRQTRKLWQQSLFVRWEHEKFDAGDESGTINLILPGVSWSRTLTRGGANPYWGNHLAVQFMGGHTSLFSDINLFKTVLSMKWLRTFRSKHKLIMSLDYGAIASDEFSQIPASHRFYVGGDRSIRGFKYRSISPEDDDGNLLGGRFKEVGSIEYDYNFFEKWSAAVFLDAGRAFDKFDERYHVGTGVGVRWQSPVGPLRLDMGFGISEVDIPILFHLSIGPEL
ncbi:MAG: BamA/TamA family outer membrane protein, partial [Gammaproteobacteria bacterium]|nr:BamA/TamA family outer membrane protein [Gammaproteobacteria bacterium]